MRLYYAWLPLGLVLAACCSLYFAPLPQGLAVRCQRTCTTAEVAAVPEVVASFTEAYPGFDPSQTLEVTFVEKNDIYAGRTYDRKTVAVVSLAVLPHELLHVHYWRSVGDPDRNHEAPGGPWTEEDNETTRAIRIAHGI